MLLDADLHCMLGGPLEQRGSISMLSHTADCYTLSMCVPLHPSCVTLMCLGSTVTFVGATNLEVVHNLSRGVKQGCDFKDIRKLRKYQSMYKTICSSRTRNHVIANNTLSHSNNPCNLYDAKNQGSELAAL